MPALRDAQRPAPAARLGSATCPMSPRLPCPRRSSSSLLRARRAGGRAGMWPGPGFAVQGSWLGASPWHGFHGTDGGPGSWGPSGQPRPLADRLQTRSLGGWSGGGGLSPTFRSPPAIGGDTAAFGDRRPATRSSGSARSRWDGHVQPTGLINGILTGPELGIAGQCRFPGVLVARSPAGAPSGAVTPRRAFHLCRALPR